jgi:DNA-binding CsgD family transcriptional regulator
MLAGRVAERALLDRLLQDVRTGQSAVRVLRGEAGIGKTALLDYAVERAQGYRVVRAVGVESEMELPFAGLQLLCAPLLDALERLPSPQREALGTAVGLSSSARPDRFLVGLAVLSLLSDAAEPQPLLCVVDDAQWLDRSTAQVLAFIARRLEAESIAFLFAERETPTLDELDGLPDMRLEGLSDADARELLRAVTTGPLDQSVRERIVAETRGNPLALLELPRGMSPAKLAGGFGVASTLEVPRRIEASFRERVKRLPPDSQQLLLLAAAEPIGDPTLLWRAATELGISMEAAHPLEPGDFLSLGARITFRHPLLRSAIYDGASNVDRRMVHRALATATNPESDPDRRAWHLAQATVGLDDDVADELERSAARAQDRGGLAAAGAFLEKATLLTPDAARRAERALAAAEAQHQAGAPGIALRLLAGAEVGSLDEIQRARVCLLRGRIAFSSSNGRDAPPLLLDAARQLETHDVALARDAYLEALVAGLFVGRLGGEVGVVQVAEAAHLAPASSGRPSDLLLDGFAVAITDSYAAGAPLLKRAVRAFRCEDLPTHDAIRWLWPATHAAHDLWDDESWELLSARHVKIARDVGALTVLPLALSARLGIHLYAGELVIAASLVEEIAAVSEATRNRIPPYGALVLAAWQGREAEARELIRTVSADLGPRGEGMGLTLVEHATAVLYNGLGRYHEACEAARRGAAHSQELAFSTWSLVQLVEAAVRSDQAELAHDALRRLVQTTEPSGTDWALGTQARCRALVSSSDAADGFYRDAIDHLGRTRLRGELARAHLLYGEWLRRARRRLDAREHLRVAVEMFTAMGMEAFAGRAARELAATGERARKRRVETREDLTPQEAQIARLASEGRSNPEIGAQLFISPRTAEYHLRKVFPKLGISSRRDLRGALQAAGRAGSAA